MLTIYFFNQHDVVLIYKKIGVNPDDPVTRSKPVIRALGRFNHWFGFENTA
jgi:hypothetical protein